ncbi:hypothetical protein BDD12DRAFT_513898 [Trichophaea hybrida]|nr:hypothetical protein BDD12DRAFT_513898 [Trichophaea hybrida]
MPSLYLRLLRQWLNNSFLLSSLRRHQIQQEVVAGTSHPPKPPTASPHLHSNSNNTLNTSPYTSLKTLKTQILALETREAELRKSLQHSANAKRALTEVIDELRGRVGKLEGSSVVEELQRRVEKLQDQNGVVEALERGLRG